jgi:hypothetical protein
LYYETTTAEKPRHTGDSLDLQEYKLISMNLDLKNHFGYMPNTAGIAHDIKSDTLWMVTDIGTVRFTWEPPTEAEKAGPKVQVKYFENETIPKAMNVVFVDIR